MTQRRIPLLAGACCIAVATLLLLAPATGTSQSDKAPAAKPPPTGERQLGGATYSDNIDDPAEWGKAFPEHYRLYKKSIDMQRTKHGGSEAMPQTPTKADPRSVVARSKVEEDAGLKAMWQGYAFSEDFREERGHFYMLEDQRLTKRQVVVKQPGACVNCHASMYLPYKKAGNGDIVKGFDKINAMPYAGGVEAGDPSRRLHRLPRRQDARAAGHPPGVHRRHARLQGFAGRQGLRREQAGLHRGDARLRVRPVPRRVLLQGPPEESRLSLGEGPQGRADHRLLRRDRLP